MIDYINTPRELIYKHRDNLNDFGVKDISTLNGRLFQLLSEHYLSTDGAEELILQCFNNAYYLCTIILLEDMPHLKIGKYEETLLKMKECNRDVCAASFAMVYEMLQMCEPKYDRDSLLLKAIYHRFSYGEWIGLREANTFYMLINKVKKDDIVLPPNEFAPRDIVEAIEDVDEKHFVLLADGIAYICERLACIDDPQRRLLGADLTSSYLDSTLKAIYENYDPPKNKFDSYYLSNDAADYLESIVDSVIKAIGDINDFKQKTPIEAQRKPKKTAEADLAPLQARIKEQQNTIVKLTEENKELKEQLAGAQERIEELEEQVAQYRNMTQGTALGLNQAQASLFVLSLANTFGFNYTNKKNLAPIAHSLFGWGESKLAKYMSISCNAEERGEFANLFKDICPKLYKTIMNKGKVTPEETPEETPPA